MIALENDMPWSLPRLPAPPYLPGTIRLFRGESIGHLHPYSVSGRWFTDRLMYALDYSQRIFYIDLPVAEAALYHGANQGVMNSEFLLPDALARQAQRLHPEVFPPTRPRGGQVAGIRNGRVDIRLLSPLAGFALGSYLGYQYGSRDNPILSAVSGGLLGGTVGLGAALPNQTLALLNRTANNRISQSAGAFLRRNSLRTVRYLLPGIFGTSIAVRLNAAALSFRLNPGLSFRGNVAAAVRAALIDPALVAAELRSLGRPDLAAIIERALSRAALRGERLTVQAIIDEARVFLNTLPNGGMRAFTPAQRRREILRQLIWSDAPTAAPPRGASLTVTAPATLGQPATVMPEPIPTPIPPGGHIGVLTEEEFLTAEISRLRAIQNNFLHPPPDTAQRIAAAEARLVEIREAPARARLALIRARVAQAAIDEELRRRAVMSVTGVRPIFTAEERAAQLIVLGPEGYALATSENAALRHGFRALSGGIAAWGRRLIATSVNPLFAVPQLALDEPFINSLSRGADAQIQTPAAAQRLEAQQEEAFNQNLFMAGVNAQRRNSLTGPELRLLAALEIRMDTTRALDQIFEARRNVPSTATANPFAPVHYTGTNWIHYEAWHPHDAAHFRAIAEMRQTIEDYDFFQMLERRRPAPTYFRPSGELHDSHVDYWMLRNLRRIGGGQPTPAEQALLAKILPFATGQPLPPTGLDQAWAYVNRLRALVRKNVSQGAGPGLRLHGKSSGGETGHKGRQFWLYRGRDRDLLLQTLRNMEEILQRDRLEESGKTTTKISVREPILPDTVPGLPGAVITVIRALKYDASLVRNRGPLGGYYSVA